MKIKKSLTISIPAYNEEETLERVAKEALGALKLLTSKYQLLLINDGSGDKTSKIMFNLSKRYSHIKVINHKINRGFSAVIAEGLFTPSTELVFLAPADGQFDFRQLKKFVKLIGKYDAVFGYRVQNSENISRKVQSMVYRILGRVLFGIKLKEFSSVYLWRTDILRDIKVVSDSGSNAAQMEIVYKAHEKGAKFGQVPISWGKRKGGKAKGVINLKLIFSTLWEMIKLWWVVRHGKVF